MFLIVAALPNKPADIGSLKDYNFLGLLFSIPCLIILSFASASF